MIEEMLQSYTQRHKRGFMLKVLLVVAMVALTACAPSENSAETTVSADSTVSVTADTVTSATDSTVADSTAR